MNRHSSAFTLIELLVVIAIIAILSVVVILTLNPSQLLQQSRDSNRVSDMASLNTALGIYSEDQSSGSLGSSSVVYVSIADPSATSTLGDQCQGLGLPSLPSLYTYHCAASSTLRNVNGQGWIPVNFSGISIGAPLSQLPIDPLNTSSTRNYYTYTTNGTQYEVTSAMESAQYKLGGSNDVIGTDGGTSTSVYEKGSRLGLEPLDYGDSSLVGLWSFNEGTGTIAYDYSGNGNTANLFGNPPFWGIGKVGPYALNQISSSSDSVTYNISSSQMPSKAISVSAWIYTLNNANFPNYAYDNWCGVTGSWLLYSDAGADAIFGVTSGSSCGQYNAIGTGLLTTNTWHFLMGTYDGSNVKMYVDGLLVGSSSLANQALYQGTNLQTGDGSTTFRMDDLRVYNRALSASEIAAMYAGGK